MSGRNWVERQWDAEGENASALGGLALRLLSVAFGGVSHLRTTLYDRGVLRPARAPVPVISVGNLTVGGTGKTPVVRWIVGLLKEEGLAPGVVLRGYGGDETQLHRRWHEDVPVVESPRRIEGVRAAAAAGADVVVCDDAFQHRGLARDLDIVLLSAHDTRLERLLPAGPYREPLSALGRADLVLVTQKGRSAARAPSVLDRLRAMEGIPPAYAVELNSNGWMRLSGEPSDGPEGPLLLVTGVASPGTVRTLLAEVEPESSIEEITFPDHHSYTQDDVDRILDRAGTRSIVTTEKDAVKLMAFSVLKERVCVLGLTVTGIDDEAAVRLALRRACSP